MKKTGPINANQTLEKTKGNTNITFPTDKCTIFLEVLPDTLSFLLKTSANAKDESTNTSKPAKPIISNAVIVVGNAYLN